MVLNNGFTMEHGTLVFRITTGRAGRMYANGAVTVHGADAFEVMQIAMNLDHEARRIQFGPHAFPVFPVPPDGDETYLRCNPDK